MRIAIASDAGDSGHKSVSQAIAQAGAARGHATEHVDLWPENSVVANDVLFQMFRDYAHHGVSGLPPVIELPDLEPVMARDLMAGLALPDCDALVGVHPWAAYFFAELAGRDGFDGPVLAVNTDFYPFPPLVHPRIDLYTGVFPKLVVRPVHRARQRSIGMPVRAGFARPAPDVTERDVLLVAVGARPFLPMDQVMSAAATLQRAVPDAQVVVCAGRGPADGAARDRSDGLDVRGGLDDLSELMTRARLVATRPSGATVAEAITARAVPVLLPSDVPWEADAARHLVYEGLAVPWPSGALDAGPVVEAWTATGQLERIVRTGSRLELGQSAGRLWDLIEAGRPAADGGQAAALPPAESSLLACYIDRLEKARTDDPMKQTAEFLLRGMLDWYTG